LAGWMLVGCWLIGCKLQYIERTHRHIHAHRGCLAVSTAVSTAVSAAVSMLWQFQREII
tara:strand:- start:333 stop:509 length:177 start_codon:yes stop_codon:yes gene_type:complete